MTDTITARELLAQAPATPHADAELKVANGRVNERDALDGYGRSQVFRPTLSAEAQNELASSYQWALGARAAVSAGQGRGAGRGRLEAEITRREAHLDHLIGSVFRLIRTVVDDKVTQFNLPRTLHEDLLTEAYTIAIERTRTYDPTHKGSYAGFIGNRLRNELGKVIRQLRVTGAATDSWHRVAAIVHRGERELRLRLGRAASDDELTAYVQEHCEAWARERFTPAQQALPVEEQQRLIRQKLVKQGMARGIGDVREIRARMGTEVSLDAPVGGDGDDVITRQDLLSDGVSADLTPLAALDAGRVMRIISDALAGLDGEVAAKVLERLATGQGDGRSSASATLRQLRARLAAPHTQWAALGSRVEHQFEPELDQPSPILAALLS